MQTILQSGFLQALALALLKSIWQMGLLWLVIVFVLRVLKLSSSQKFTIAFIAQALGFVLFIYTLFNAYNNQQNLQGFKAGNISYINNAAGVLNYILPFIAMLYIFFLAWHITKLFFNYRVTQSIRNNNLTKMPAANRIFVEELTELFCLHKTVKIYLSKTIKCPLTIGFFKPLILIPLAAVNYLTKEQMEAVIVHEMAHIKRADYLIYLLQCVIEKVFFFNIFSKMINDIIDRERENACDDWVLQFKYNSFHYAEALLKLGKLQTSSSLAMAAAGKKENTLFYRVKRLIHHSEKNITQEYSALRFSFLSLIIALVLIASFSSRTSGLVTGSIISHQSPAASNEKNYNRIFELRDRSFITQATKLNNADKLLAANKTFVHASATKKNIVTNKRPGKTGKTADVQTIAPDYFVNANQAIDSVKQLSYSDALNKKLVLNANTYKKVLSYQNFKQLETMLALTGDSISVTEDAGSKDSYKKLITIETIDKNGNKNVYKVIVELYQ